MPEAGEFGDNAAVVQGDGAGLVELAGEEGGRIGAEGGELLGADIAGVVGRPALFESSCVAVEQFEAGRNEAYEMGRHADLLVLRGMNLAQAGWRC